MGSIERVLIVGGGTSGCALAILLARAGIVVELAEISVQPATRGSGITLMGNGLRVLRELGVWDTIRDDSYGFDGAEVRTAAGDFLQVAPQPQTGGPDFPAVVGARRPSLAEILTDAALQAGAVQRLGVTVAAVEQDDDGVDVQFTDGGRRRFDLIVGADGIRSSMRQFVHPDTVPQPTGAGIWRSYAPRPDTITRTALYVGGEGHLAGITPTGEDSVYTFIIEDYVDRLTSTPEQLGHEFLQASASYGAEWNAVRDSVADGAPVNYTAIETLLLPAPWHKGRIVLIGDAVHACPPTLAQGASMGWEDALVLSDLLLGSSDVSDELFETYRNRRIERVEAVVEGSSEVIRRMIAGVDTEQVELMRRVAPLLTAPA